MKQLAIQSKGRVFFALVDDEDYPLLSRHKWYILFSGKQQRPYAFTRFFTEHDVKNGKTFLMHHMIMGTSGAVDHINNNSLDNRKENLRVATYQENAWNTGKRRRCAGGKTPSSAYKGVIKCTGVRGNVYYRVLLKLSKKHEKPERYVRLGPFDSEIDAAKVYNEEVVKHRGQYAWVNPISDNVVNIDKSIG